MTIDEYLELSVAHEAQDTTIKEIPIGNTGKYLRCGCPSITQQMNFITAVKMSDSNDSDAMYHAYKRLVYDCCSELHDKTLLDKLGITNPVDIIDRIMYPIDCMEIGDKIADAFFRANIIETIKNA